MRRIDSSEKVILNDESGIPDAALYKAALKALHCKPEGLTAGRAGHLRELTVGDAPWFEGDDLKQDFSLKSFCGIGYFRGLRKLTVSFGRATDLEPLSELSELKTLSLDSPVKSLAPLRMNRKLRSLDLINGEMQDVAPLLDLPALKYLSLCLCSTSDISCLAQHKGIKHLGLCCNHEIGKYDFLQEMTQLDNLELDEPEFDSVTSLHGLKGLFIPIPVPTLKWLRNFPQLRALVLTGGHPANLDDLRYLPDLTRLDLNFAEVGDISALGELSQLSELRFSASADDLSPVKNLTRLRKLQWRGENITDLSPLAGLTELNDLSLDRFTGEDVSMLQNLSALRSLDLQADSLRDISALGALHGLKNLSLKAPIEDLETLRTMSALQYVSLQGGSFCSIAPLTGIQSLQELWIVDCPVSDLTAIGTLQKLQRLIIEGISCIDFSPLLRLHTLRSLYTKALPGNADFLLQCLENNPHLEYVYRRSE